jgi:hypothetical protein
MRVAANCGMRTSIAVLPVVVLALTGADARLGETSLQFVGRYGPPRDTPSSRIYDKNSPLLEGAIHHTYEYKGWKIRAAFLQLDGPAMRMEYQKLGASPQIRDYELQAIMTGNTAAGSTWEQIPYSNPDSPNQGVNKAVESYLGNATGQKMWQRSDGAILSLRSNLIVRLDLPAAREYEAKLKAAKDQKARASVPTF